jgi:hypothetical protein
MKKFIAFIISIIISLLLINAALSFSNIDYQFMQLVFADSFRAEKDARLFFVDEKRIYKLADYSQNANVFPENTDNHNWNVDKLGFRPDIKSNEEITAETYKILMIGDSFTYGGEVEHLDTYPTKLEEILLGSDQNINVINAGVPGYGPDQELIYLQELIPKLQPNLIIWNIYENDITDSNYYCLFNRNNNELEPITTWKNNVYRQGYIVNTLPWIIARQPITKMMVQFIGYPIEGNQILPISTIGCTKEVNQNLLEELGLKMNLILHKAQNTAMKNNLKIEFVLMPTQQSFIEHEEPIEELEKVEIIKNLEIFNNTPLFDLTEKMANYHQETNIDIANELYLSEEEEPGAFSKHLNQSGNSFVANEVYKYLMTKDYFPVKDNQNLN